MDRTERTRTKSEVSDTNLPNGESSNNIANQEIGVPGKADAHPGWHSRGYLPHYDGLYTTQHVTLHLADSLPANVLERLNREIEALPEEKQNAELRKRVEAWIDAGHGSCVLREPAIAQMAQQSLLFFDGQRYRLLAWVVMPNHVHVLFHPIDLWTVAKIVASWKKFTASRICDFRKSSAFRSTYLSVANQEIGVPGNATSKPVWHREYWDRYIRNERHHQETVNYIHRNPVKAGLVAQPEHWPWSSAATRQEERR
jgi:REP element-mobilizing transposase RayT